MAQKTDVELLAQKEIIKTETANNANTATRVGQMLEDIIDSKVNNDEMAGSGVTSVNGDTGPVVVLTAAEVGADVAGSAASVANALSDHITAAAAEFRRVRSVTGTSSIVQADDNGLIIFNSASPFNFTLDQLTANIAGNQTTKVSFINIGAGAVTFINGSGVTLVGSAVLAGAVGTTYPGTVIYYDTATQPRIVNSGPNDLALITVDTSSTPIALDFNNEKERMFVGSASFAVPKTFTFSNAGNALVFTLTLTITNIAGVITFPSTVQMNTQDSRYSTGAKSWTVQVAAEGKYVFGASWDGTNWNMAVEGPLG